MSEQSNMAMVLQALKNAGLNDNQARILGAEIGRENSFQDKYLWGYHIDPKNKAINVGIISWQGERGRGVERALRNAGLIKDGKIIKGQASLDVMARYLVNEIRTNPKYAATKKQFLDNPNVDYHTGTRVLGKNYIRWRYDDPAYASGHKNRDSFYAKLGGITPAGGENQVADVDNGTQTTASYSNPLLGSQPFLVPNYVPPPMTPIQSTPEMPNDLFGLSGGNGLGINLDLMATLPNLAAQNIQQPILPTTYT